MLRNLLTKVNRHSAFYQPNRSTSRLSNLSISAKDNQTVHYNLSYPEIQQHYLKNQEGVRVKTQNGLVNSIDTGKYTGRSPKDKWLVASPETAENVWWGQINQLMDPVIFDQLAEKCVAHFQGLDQYYIYDGHCGASLTSQKRVRFYTEYVWQHHFVKNMFIGLGDQKGPGDFTPDFTIINACNVTNPDWERHGLHSEIFIAFNLDTNLGIIGGTHYGGCMKKGMFSLMNYHLPLDGIMTMHCSANVGSRGDTALFFGLSGTGKTTLSADPKRQLIGDDEHGWDEQGIFNLEGGCYAKTAGLRPETEPDIYQAIRQNALLENIWYDEHYQVDYHNTSKTLNGRVSYPLQHIDNVNTESKGGHPKDIIFLTCDAFGVLPPISRLDHGQAMYHFLSGYTAKVAGTERGVDEPEATFSACFGAAFLPLHPSKYADLLLEKLKAHGSRVWLVNTGWSGGKYGVGERMSIKTTRSCLNAILEGTIDGVSYQVDSHFGFHVPTQVPYVDPLVLDPINTWSSPEEYLVEKEKLIRLFQDNYQQFVGDQFTDYRKYGPTLLTK